MAFTELDQTALFDLDNTLTRRDTFVPFLLGLMLRNPWSCIVTPVLAVAVCRYFSGRIDNNALKRRFVYWVFRLCTQRSIENWSRRFAERVLCGYLYDDARIALARHRKLGKVMIVSASIECYVEPLSALLNVDKAICTRLERDVQNRYTGYLSGENCYGEEKVRRLVPVLGGNGKCHTVVYSDHHSDLPILEMADAAFAVNPTAQLRALAAEKGFEILHWR